MVYLICTEDKYRYTIEWILNQRFDDYAISESQGCWKGKPKKAITISIVPPSNLSPSSVARMIEEVAVAIKQINKQEAVLVLSVPATAIFI